MKVTRRDFLKMAAYAAAATGASQFDIIKLQKALSAAGDHIPVIWYEGLGDSGCVVSLANYFDGTNGIDYHLLNTIELKFSSVLMGAAGQLAIDEAEKVYQGTPPYDQPYVLVLTGAMTNLDGYCIVGYDTDSGNAIPDGSMQLVDAFSRWEGGATYVLLVGSCACYGGVNTIGGNISHNVPWSSPPTHNGPPSYNNTRNINYDYNKTVFIPGCPAHPDWIILTIAELLTSGMPARDDLGRPTTLLGNTIFGETVHQNCPRKLKHDQGEFADHVGDPVRCLRKVGCRGKDAYGPCPVISWNNTDIYNNGKVAFCNAPGVNHICIGCTQPFFPDVPFNRKIDNIDTTP